MHPIYGTDKPLPALFCQSSAMDTYFPPLLPSLSFPAHSKRDDLMTKADTQHLEMKKRRLCTYIAGPRDEVWNEGWRHFVHGVFWSICKFPVVQ